ncbi:protein S40-4-like [Phragmites australis]|uniref:protein S40-4-like n=1 Tax=Phragmites australis TaxID=29695 RepID=UPI002D77A9CC|nr:protein S40-4-like [Phragmites australis]
MAGSARSAAAKHAYRIFGPSRGAAARSPSAGSADEFDESDVVWGSFAPAGGVDYSSPTELATARARPIPASRAGRKKPLDGRGTAAAPGSLPMNIPDWQKILGVEYRDHYSGEWELDGDDGDEYGRVGSGGGAVMIPPHELAWRSRAASLSVHEGIGRTLKGRDLSRVRDAVWKQTGFED